MSKAKKPGVVILRNDYSEDGLAALQWAGDSLVSKETKLVILFINEDAAGSNEPGEELVGDKLSAALTDNVLDKELDKYREKFGSKNVSGIPYQGPSIQKMLEGAIKKFHFDTLVLGMAAVRKTLTAGKIRIDLLLNLECSVVLAKTNPKPPMPKTAVENPAGKNVAEASTARKNKTKKTAGHHKKPDGAS